MPAWPAGGPIGSSARGLEATEALVKATGQTLRIQSVAVPMDDVALPLYNTHQHHNRQRASFLDAEYDT